MREFSAKLGEDFSGAWSDESTFLVTVTDTTAHFGVAVGSTFVAVKKCQVRTAYMCGDVTNAARTSPPTEDSRVLDGDFGARRCGCSPQLTQC